MTIALIIALIVMFIYFRFYMHALRKKILSLNSELTKAVEDSNKNFKTLNDTINSVKMDLEDKNIQLGKEFNNKMENKQSDNNKKFQQLNDKLKYKQKQQQIQPQKNIEHSIDNLKRKTRMSDTEISRLDKFKQNNNNK